MFYKKFIGQSGKRVVTLNVIPNELQTPAVKDKDEILIMATTPPVIVPLSLPDRSSQASQPLTLQVFGIIRYDTIQYDTIPSHLFVKREISYAVTVNRSRLFYSNCSMLLHCTVRLKGRPLGSSIWSETAVVSLTCSRDSCALKLHVTSAGT